MFLLTLKHFIVLKFEESRDLIKSCHVGLAFIGISGVIGIILFTINIFVKKVTFQDGFFIWLKIIIWWFLGMVASIIIALIILAGIKIYEFVKENWQIAKGRAEKEIEGEK